VREIDALGGVMGLAADACGIQFRMLNTAKGPAVRAPRSQEDKIAYPLWMRRHLTEHYPTLTVAEGEAVEILTENGSVCGVRLLSGETLRCRAAIVTAGTFLDGVLHIGMETRPGGRWGNPPSVQLAENLRQLGLQTQLLKTGTPPRLYRESIRWDDLPQQAGDDPIPYFSYSTPPNGPADSVIAKCGQVSCAITRTNPRTHEIILGALDRSPLYTGRIVGTGPRYCPSIETKLVRFEDRDSHQIFLEPESIHNNLIYINGVSTSLPPDVQDEFLPTIEGLEKVKIARYGYAIEYLAFSPTQMRPTLETQAVPGLYLAGQVNGTTGYEEAGALGLIAGANAALKIKNEAPLIFRRDEAYIGVMIDDLITKGAPEPYRLFTSRAEYRLLLRQDNADLRLTASGRAAGLVDDTQWRAFERYHDLLESESERLDTTRVRPSELDVATLEENGVAVSTDNGISLDRLLARTNMTYALLEKMGLGSATLEALRQTPEDRTLVARVVEQVEARIKYAGYIDRQKAQVERHLGLETTPFPTDIPLSDVPSLRTEAAQILAERTPATLGQASRLPGVNPADITALMIYMKTREKK
ncbi:TPA: tRNA uridine-5-carboxymethylaminomethyl(34) synthesis enzyme MnmG, partial [Candidatus Sumerlaeota bacterium]|nr:tRNA uridine-5-carboxymethylaminomethyl(34) synthesis enzyme MnmG [Candidatus Sumerlaeota bacterium]